MRHAFDYPYAEIAPMLEVTEANARQLVSRAGKHVAAAREHRTVVASCVSARSFGQIDPEGALP